MADCAVHAYPWIIFSRPKSNPFLGDRHTTTLSVIPSFWVTSFVKDLGSSDGPGQDLWPLGDTRIGLARGSVVGVTAVKHQVLADPSEDPRVFQHTTGLNMPGFDLAYIRFRGVPRFHVMRLQYT